MSSSETQMVNPPHGQHKMVKIKAKHPIRIMKDKVEHIVQPGEVVQVSEAEASEFCDKQINIGYKGAFGQVDKGSIRPKAVVRAERVK